MIVQMYAFLRNFTIKIFNFMKIIILIFIEYIFSNFTQFYNKSIEKILIFLYSSSRSLNVYHASMTMHV